MTRWQNVNRFQRPTDKTSLTEIDLDEKGTHCAWEQNVLDCLRMALTAAEALKVVQPEAILRRLTRKDDEPRDHLG